MSLMRSSTTLLLLLALSAFGCESKKTGGESSAAANAAPGATPETAAKTPAAGKNSYPKPDKFDIAPLAVGQWVRMLVNTQGQPPAQTYVRIVGKEGDSFWYEIESNTPNGTTIIQILTDDLTKGEFSKGSLKKMKLKVGTGPVQEFSGPLLIAASAAVDSYVHLLGRPNLDKAERGDTTVNAGEFKGCYIHDIEQSIMGMAMKLKSWNHPAVPINGFVRSQGTVNGSPTTTELFEMHMDGAKSSLP